MYVAHPDLEVIHYPLDEVFHEAIQTVHIPRKLGPVNLTCKDDELHEGTEIFSHLGIPRVPLLHFDYKIAVTELVENKLLRMEGEDRNAKVAILVALHGLGRQAATRVNVEFSLKALSPKAQRAERIFGDKQTNCLSQGVVHGIFASVVSSLDAQAELQRLSA